MRVLPRLNACLLMTVIVAGGTVRPGRADLTDMLALMKQITALAHQGRYAEAVGLARRLESEAERVTGPQSPLTATTLVTLAKALQAQGQRTQMTEAETLLRRALAIREKSLGPNHTDVASALETLSQIELKQNRVNDAERDVSRAIRIDENALGPDHLVTALARMQLGNLRHRQMRDAEAIDIFNRALTVFRNPNASGPADLMVATALNNIAEIYRAQGRLQPAEERFVEALSLEEKLFGADSVHVIAILSNLGELRREQGRLAEAEQLAQRSLTIREKVLGPDHPDVAISLNNLAIVFSKQGRAAEAERLLERAFAIHQKVYGPEHPITATTLNNVALAQTYLGRINDAEQLYSKSLAIREKSLGPMHVDVAISLDNLAILLVKQQRYVEAEPLARRSLAIREAALGGSHPLVADSLNNLAVILDSLGQHQDAEPLLRRSLDIRVRALGQTHPDVANSLNNLGAHYLDVEDWQQAYDVLSRAASILTSRGAMLFEETRADVKRIDETNPFPGLILAAFRVAETSDSRRAAALRSQAFDAAQWIGDEQAAKAIAGMSARLAAGRGELPARIRERQDLNQQALAIDQQLVAALSQPDTARNPEAEQALRNQALAIANRIRQLDGAIAAQFPEYATLVARTPVALEEIQKQLAPKDALLLFSSSKRFTFIWTVTQSDVRWHVTPLGERQLTEAVAALRCGLDSGAWRDKSQEALCAERLGLQGQPGPGDPLPFDQERAYALYKALLEPVANTLDGKELIVVPSGPLATLPFEVLLTEAPLRGSARQDLAKAPWLVKRFATTVLPSVSSLKALRQFAQKSKATRPFIGVGDPLLNGDAQDASDVERARLARQLQSCGEALEGRNQQLAQRATRSAVVLTGGLADIEQLKRQPPLPETALELCYVAKSFAPAKGEVVLGSEATEAKLKAMSENGLLQQYRILHFATHGALAGQVRGSIEPGLIMTPPATATPVDDGYLTSSEISALKLDADWVVLSACSTGGGEGANSEAFSGLARAFFYAGSRSLLVSHWPVRSDAAIAITTGAMDVMNAHPGTGRSEALRQAILALMARSPDHAHPSVWGPFVLVGNGGT
jgi:CHAT domain-containing protein